MALYDRAQTQSFYSQIAHGQDICFYCEKAAYEEAQEGKISRDELHKKLKSLRGQFVNKRVMKFDYVGHDFCVCPECLSKINAEVNPAKETVVEPVKITEQVTPTEEVAIASTDKAINDNKTVTKGKANATKKA